MYFPIQRVLMISDLSWMRFYRSRNRGGVGMRGPMIIEPGRNEADNTGADFQLVPCTIRLPELRTTTCIYLHERFPPMAGIEHHQCTCTCTCVPFCIYVPFCTKIFFLYIGPSGCFYVTITFLVMFDFGLHCISHPPVRLHD